MRWIGARLSVAVLLAGLAGCQTIGPMMREPTVLLPAGAAVECDHNPFFVPAVSYGKVFETLLHVLHDYDFEIADSHRYDGHIEAVPRVSPGLAQILKPGMPMLSTIWLRMHAPYTGDKTRMPQLATYVIDDKGTQLVSDWITSITACP